MIINTDNSNNCIIYIYIVLLIITIYIYIYISIVLNIISIHICITIYIYVKTVYLYITSQVPSPGFHPHQTLRSHFRSRRRVQGQDPGSLGQILDPGGTPTRDGVPP